MEHQRQPLSKENTIERKYKSARFPSFSLSNPCSQEKLQVRLRVTVNSFSTVLFKEKSFSRLLFANKHNKHLQNCVVFIKIAGQSPPISSDVYLGCTSH